MCFNKKIKINFFILILLLINCASTQAIKTLPKECKRIYSNSNNVQCFGQYISLNGAKSTNSGLFFFFQKDNEKRYFPAFSVLYRDKKYINFSKAIVYGDIYITLPILKKDKLEKNNGDKVEYFDFNANFSVEGKSFLDHIYNFYKANQNIKIKFIGKDGKSYIVPVPQQQRKDLIELVDYYRMLTHKSE